MNILHMKYAVEVARLGSLNKAAEALFIAQPNISRSIKELESHLGIVIFDRSTKGMSLTPKGEEFINYAQSILKQIDQVEKIYTSAHPEKQLFSVCVPRASYIAEAFIQFSKTISKKPAEIFYKETNSQKTINNVLNNDYRLGVIRYSENYDKYFKQMLKEKGLEFELVTEFQYRLVLGKNNPLAQKSEITFDDLKDFIEIAHADPYVPSLPLARVVREELPDNIERRIYIFERASQFELLSENLETFMWCSLVPKKYMERHHLVQRECIDNKKNYKDVLIYKKGYQLTSLDKQFIAELRNAKSQYL